MASRYHAFVLTTALVCAGATLAQAAGTVTGRGRFEKIKGRPSAGYTELYEWNGYLSAEGESGATQSFRLGTGGGGGGYYSWSAAAGTYNIYVSQPIFFARPKLVTEVQVNDGMTTTQNTDLNLDYSCYFTSDWDPGWANVWYQTFTATGTSINRIDYRVAGPDTRTVQVAVLRDDGGAIQNWPTVGITKSAGSDDGDNWVGFRSGQIATTPGQRYAIRLVGNADFTPFSRVDGGDGYANGQGYKASSTTVAPSALNRDLCIVVFSDNDGTVIPYCGTGGNMEQLTEWCGTCGQTYKATGQGLAACDFWFATGDVWDFDVRFTVRQNGPGGAQVGMSKIGHGAWAPGGVGMMGVSWAPGEVNLTPGQTYYIEMVVGAGATGFNPMRFYLGADAYADGQAYISGGSRTFDLNMTIMEYAQVTVPTISRSPATLTPSVREGLNASPQSFTVANSGSGTLNYTISDNVDWLSVNPASGSATVETDTIAVNYTTSGLAAGVHTGTITISDPAATNNPQTITVTLTVTAATPAGFFQPGWNLTSVPVLPTNPSPTSVFQDLISLGNVIENNLYRWDNGLISYVMYPDGFGTITRGLGYWLYLTNAPAGTVVSVPGTVATGSITLTLPQGWNLIGHPHPVAEPLAACQVQSGATTLSFDAAVAAGWVTGTLYYWDPAGGYQALTTAGYGDDLSLRPWRGYWIRTNIGPLSLIIPKP
jgi:hypothetical protein